LRRVTNKLDGVVNVGSALSGVEDTSGVVLPWLSIAADGQRHGFEGSIDGRLASSNRNNLANANSRRASAGSATSINTTVRVARFGIKSVSLDPAKSFTGVSTTASRVGVIAINELLRSSGGDTTSSDEVSRFRFFSGGESPARTTLSLILNCGGLSSCNPIDEGSRGSQLFTSLLNNVGVKGLSGTESKESFELFKRPVSELRVTKGSTWAVLVGFGDLRDGEYEVAESILALFFRSVCSVPEHVELFKGNLIRNTFGSVVVSARRQEGDGEYQEQ
jgi:hypothetical protein